MKTILLLLFALFGLLLPARAQYGFSTYLLYSTGTNASIGATTNSATITNSATVAAGNYVQLYMRGRLVGTNGGTVAADATNYVNAYLDESWDGTRWTNQFIWGTRALTTNEFWDYTNRAITLPYLRLRFATNQNAAALTNFYFYVGQKRGL